MVAECELIKVKQKFQSGVSPFNINKFLSTTEAIFCPVYCDSYQRFYKASDRGLALWMCKLVKDETMVLQ